MESTFEQVDPREIKMRT